MVVIINGMPTSGKSTFVELCQELQIAHVEEYSTVDFVKEIAGECGWDGVKTPKNRKFLSDLKDLLTEWGDVPFNKTIEFINKAYDKWAPFTRDNAKQTIIFVHCREPKEIQRFKDFYGEWCTTLLIRRPTVETNDQSNHADEQVFEYQYEHTIVNDGTIQDLIDKAYQFIRELSE